MSRMQQLAVPAAGESELVVHGLASPASPGATEESTIVLDEPAWVRVTVDLDAMSMRPGLALAVRIDDRLVLAPMAASENPWQGEGNAITGPAPAVAGHLAAGTRVGGWVLLGAGPHSICLDASPDAPAAPIAGLRVGARSADAPLERFAMISDSHLTDDPPSEWMNRKMGPRTADVLAQTLARLAAEGIGTVLYGGDLTDRCRADEFATFAAIHERSGVRGFACLGNHDLYDRSTAGQAITRELRSIFPDGRTAYRVALGHGELVVLDSESIVEKGAPPARPESVGERHKDPAYTLVMRHYPLAARGGRSSAGFALQDWRHSDDETTALLDGGERRPVVVVNGHTHWSERSRSGGAEFIQNAAFCEWPATYRVFTWTGNGLAYETRQAASRDYVNDSAIPSKRLTWMISTSDDDLTGFIAR